MHHASFLRLPEQQGLAPSYRAKTVGVSIQCLLNTSINDNTNFNEYMPPCCQNLGQRAAMASSTNCRFMFHHPTPRHVRPAKAYPARSCISLFRWSQGEPCNGFLVLRWHHLYLQLLVPQSSIRVESSRCFAGSSCRGSVLAADREGAAAAARSEGMCRR